MTSRPRSAAGRERRLARSPTATQRRPTAVGRLPPVSAALAAAAAPAELAAPGLAVSAAPAAAAFGDIGVGPLRTIPLALRAAGVEPAPLLRRLGLQDAFLETESNRLTFPRAGQLLLDCTAATGAPHFGLLAGRHFELPMLGPLGYLMRHAPQVRTALRALVLHLHMHDRGAAITTRQISRDRQALTYAVFIPDMPALATVYDLAIMIGFRMLKILCGPRWSPLEVQLARAAPKDTTPYRAMFEVPVRFNAPLSMIVFEARWLDAKVPTPDPGLYRLLATLLATIDAHTPRPLTERLRLALGTGVLAGSANAAALADLFSISQRSLRRHLAREGHTLKQLITEARMMVAQQLLEQTRMPLADIATALHYSEPSALSRAFREWTGVAPRDWRRRKVPDEAAHRTT